MSPGEVVGGSSISIVWPNSLDQDRTRESVSQCAVELRQHGNLNTLLRQGSGLGQMAICCCTCLVRLSSGVVPFCTVAATCSSQSSRHEQGRVRETGVFHFPVDQLYDFFSWERVGSLGGREAESWGRKCSRDGCVVRVQQQPPHLWPTWESAHSLN